MNALFFQKPLNVFLFTYIEYLFTNKQIFISFFFTLLFVYLTKKQVKKPQKTRSKKSNHFKMVIFGNFRFFEQKNLKQTFQNNLFSGRDQLFSKK